MGRRYEATLLASNQSGGFDLFAIKAPSDAVVVVHSIEAGQNLDEGDAQAEMLRYIIADYTGADGSGGSTLTPRALNPGGPAAGSIIRAGDTTQAAGKTSFRAGAFNVQAGLLYRPVPEELVVIGPGKNWAIALSSPADSLEWDATLVFEEIGG